MRRSTLAPFVILLVAAVSCGGSGATTDSGADVGVTLKDFSVTLDRATFAPGDVTFGIANEGPSTHEFVIIRSDVAADGFSVENGLIPEDQIDLVDEAEDIVPGTTTTLATNLTAGSYVLVCNLPAHYGAGMHAAFTVA